MKQGHKGNKAHRGETAARAVVRSVVSVATFVFFVSLAAPASAELVFFNTGRTMSVKAHRVEGESVVLELRNGGEMAFASSLVERFTPDEVPYPEPEVEVAPAPAAPQAEVTAGPFSEIIDRVAAEQHVSAKLVRAVIQVESAYNVRARSAKGAMGLMQLMPATARQYDVADPYDPAANIEGGIKHLKSLLQRLPVALALAAYNAGEAAVQRFNGIPPYAETRNYVSRILAIANR
jgi:soluble lytic murein transglycosylase-like protein